LQRIRRKQQDLIETEKPVLQDPTTSFPSPKNFLHPTMSKPLVLITGATGHLGFRALVFALPTGYRARISLRRQEKSEQIKQATSIQPFLEDIEFAIVPDITKDDAFDEAIKGVEFVIHVASPIFDSEEAMGKKVSAPPQLQLQGTIG
jgi:uncharacterized protein YbjT (DUF2867 family)